MSPIHMSKVDEFAFSIKSALKNSNGRGISAGFVTVVGFSFSIGFKCQTVVQKEKQIVSSQSHRKMGGLPLSSRGILFSSL
jgi:hypothetical protein